MIRGDLAAVDIGRYFVVGEDSVIRPSHKLLSPCVPHRPAASPRTRLTRARPRSGAGEATFIKSVIGSHVIIGRRCVIESAQVGSKVSIGNDVVLVRRRRRRRRARSALRC